MLAGFDTVAGRLDTRPIQRGFINESANMPMALEPPPTQGDHRVRQASFFLKDLRLVSSPIMLNSRTVGNGAASGGAEHVVRLLVAAGPVAQRFVTGIFRVAEPLCTGTTSAPSGACGTRSARLALDVFGAHIDAAFQTEQGAGQRRGDAVLAGAGFGDNSVLPIPFGQ